MGGARKLWEELGGYGRSEEVMGGAKKLWEELGGYGRS